MSQKYVGPSFHSIYGINLTKYLIQNRHDQIESQTKPNTYMSTMINYCRNCPMARNSRKHILTCPSYGHP